MIKISPSLLSADFTNLKEEIKSINNADMLHLDIMDGHFVPNITFGPPLVKSIRGITGMVLDAHLMITNPLKYIDEFVKAGADIISIHIEADDDTLECLKLIRNLGKKSGLVINPDTDVKEIEPYLDYTDMVLLMSVYPGFGGQSYIKHVTEKIRKVKEMIGSRQIDIEIDGGITTENIKEVVEAGANVIVAGTAIFGKPDRQSEITSLRNLAYRV